MIQVGFIQQHFEVTLLKIVNTVAGETEPPTGTPIHAGITFGIRGPITMTGFNAALNVVVVTTNPTTKPILVVAEVVVVTIGDKQINAGPIHLRVPAQRCAEREISIPINGLNPSGKTAFVDARVWIDDTKDQTDHQHHGEVVFNDLTSCSGVV
jgi:hypothetical protein